MSRLLFLLYLVPLIMEVCVAAPFDYHTVRGRQAVARPSDGLFEGEDLPMSVPASEQSMGAYQGDWSGGAHLLWHGKVGEAMKTSLSIMQTGRYRVSLRLTKAPDYGVFAFSWNGTEFLTGIDLYDERVRLTEVLDLGEMMLPAGKQELAFTLTGGNPKARKYKGERYLLGVDYVNLEPLQLPEPVTLSQPDSGVPANEAVEPLASFEEMRTVLAEHCFRCHGGDEIEGKVDLKRLVKREGYLSDTELMRKVADVVRFREMPPEDEEPLPPKAHRQLTAFFDGLVDEGLQETSALPPVVMRRMNRYEYNNSVRDLLGLKGDIFALPEKVVRAAKPYFEPASGRLPDRVTVSNRALGKNQIEQHILTGVSPYAIDLQAEHGFNNRGDQLSVSPILLESFLKLGQSIVSAEEFDGYTRDFEALFRSPDGLSLAAQDSLARERLRDLLERAFRDAPSTETVDRYATRFSQELRETQSFTESMKLVVAAVLASPRFIYFTEQKASGEAEMPLTDYELATRLSFFLWSSIPDEALLADAREEKLRTPDVLDAQVARMLKDPKSQALSQSFARQWLRLDQLITAVPDFERFEVYYSRIGCEQWKFGLQTMLEPLLLFESILVEDRSIMLLVDSNYAYRSDEMQSWYNDETPFSGKANRNRFDTFTQAFSRRPLDTRREGGVITSAATLTMTSSPLRTSPIIRGSWVATVIFNRPPPPPPDIVPEIEADDAAIEAQGLTVRDRLKQHQVNASCASCHQKIDPFGFALENYDAVGRWRDNYTSGLPINASGELFGEAQFTDIVGLKDALLEHPEWFIRAFSEHLLSYALGRELTVADKPAVDRISRKTLEDRGQFSTVVREVVKSYPFRHKTNQIRHNR